MQENFVECGLGALILSWVHYLNVLLHILSQIEQKFFCIYMFLASFSPQFTGIISRNDDERHAAHAKSSSECSKKSSRLAIPVELFV